MENIKGTIHSDASELKKIVSEVFAESQLKVNEIDIIPIEEACKILNLARQTVYGKVSAGKIPFIKRPHSKKLFFSRTALLAWLQETDHNGHHSKSI